MIQKPDVRHPALVHVSWLPYEVSRKSDFFSTDGYFDAYKGIGDPLVWMRGSTWSRWNEKGYWRNAWDRYVSRHRLSIFSNAALRRVMAGFIGTANEHISRKHGYKERVPAAKVGPILGLERFGFDGYFFEYSRCVYVNGRLLWFETYQQRRVAKALAKEYERGDIETIKRQK